MPEPAAPLPRHVPVPGPRVQPVRIGLLVNPIAGLGGRVGLKGSDGDETVGRALELGAVPRASRRAAEALRAFRSAWPERLPPAELLVAPGPMGEDAAREASLVADGQHPSGGVGAGTICTFLPDPIGEPTSADDTRRLTARLAGLGVDLLLFTGGDGTARDVHAGLAAGGPVDTQPVLGIPAGVKIQSAVYATSPTAAGRIAAAWLASARRRCAEREVLDLDEDAYRRGRVRPALHGYLRVPAARGVQDRKAPTPPDEGAVLGGIAEVLVEELARGLGRERTGTATAPVAGGVPWILGPGTTVRAVAARLGVPKTLVGVDLVEWRDGTARLLVRDAGEDALVRALAGRPARIVVTPIGGQGFLFGRGNQPISPAVIRAAAAGRPPREVLAVVATPGKLAALGGRPLLVDTGDRDLDAELSGHVTAITGYRERAVVALAPA